MIFWIKYSLRSVLRRYRTTVVIFAGFTFSVAVLVFLGAVMTGVNDTMIQNALKLHSGYIFIEGKPGNYSSAVTGLERIKKTLGKNPEIIKISGRLTIPVMIQTEKNSMAFLLNGIDPENEAVITPVSKKLTEGKYLPGDGILIGKKGADILGIKVGDWVSVYTPSSMNTLKVTGIFSTGIDSFDSGMIFSRKEIFSDINETTIGYHLALFLRNNDKLKETARVISEEFKDKNIKTWEEKLPDIYQLVKLNEMAMFIMIFLVILILGFGITNTLLTSVMGRKRHFAIMKAMGIRSGEIITAIIAESSIICISSGLAGTAAGIMLVAFSSSLGGMDLSRYTSYNPNFAVNSIIMPRLTPGMTLLPQFLAVFSGIAASTIPAFRIIREKVIKGMRNI